MSSRPAVFLDRDGTVIVDRHYLADPAGVELTSGAAGAIARLNAAGVAVVLVTNQSGIGRGYFGEEEFAAVQRRLEQALGEGGARLDAVYHCPHAPDLEPACDCRKPGVGLFLRAAADHDLDLGASFYVGDRVRDVSAALRFGGTGILVGHPPPGDEAPPPGVVTTGGLGEAVEIILLALPKPAD